VTIAATASDPEAALQRVEFHVDGELIATASAAPFQCAWTPNDLGNHTLTAVAIDGIGQRTGSAVVVTVTVGPPVVRMTSPLDGAGIAPGAAVPLGASASSRAGITRIDFVADGALVASANAAPYTASWSTLTEGPHEITATAVAGDGQTAASAPITVYLLRGPPARPRWKSPRQRTAQV
jgi:chitinase